MRDEGNIPIDDLLIDILSFDMPKEGQKTYVDHGLDKICQLFN